MDSIDKLAFKMMWFGIALAFINGFTIGGLTFGWFMMHG